jgi:hypothetical protein
MTGDSAPVKFAAGRRWLVVVVVLGGWLARPAPAWACWCVLYSPLAPADAFRASDAVFEGTVTGMVDWWHAPVFGRAIRLWPALARRFYDVRVVLEVTGAWKGVRESKIMLRTGHICGYQFSPGDRYVVYAYRDGGGLRTDFCTRTNPAAAAAEDYAFLAPLPRLPLAQPGPSPGALGCGGLGALAGVAGLAAWRWRRARAAPA